uniref:Uncharacterized protein n=1 Tax=Arundo donax TaxID=35708 RepID=A0A0A8Y117_ARUDO
MWQPLEDYIRGGPAPCQRVGKTGL